MKIYSKYIAGDLQTTLHHLEGTLSKYDGIHNNYFGEKKIQKFLALFGELKLRVDEDERNVSNARVIRENLDKLQILEEIRRLKESHQNLSIDQWREGLLQRLENLQQVVKDNIPELWSGLEFELSALRILNIADCTLPLIGIILGRPAGGKTQVIGLLRKWPYSFHSDVWSPKALQSHTSTASSEEDFVKIDMLPKFKDKIFCTPEFAPLFTTNDDQLRHTLGLITRIADGNGLSSDSGIHGHREIGNTMFVWVGAAVDVPHSVNKALATLGAKIYFFRLPYRERETN